MKQFEKTEEQVQKAEDFSQNRKIFDAKNFEKLFQNWMMVLKQLARFGETSQEIVIRHWSRQDQRNREQICRKTSKLEGVWICNNIKQKVDEFLKRRIDIGESIESLVDGMDIEGFDTVVITHSKMI